jgi:hypothetical protein
MTWFSRRIDSLRILGLSLSRGSKMTAVKTDEANSAMAIVFQIGS